MSYPPLSWQTYDIFVIGGLVNVYHNGVLIQENFNSGSTDNNGRFGLQDHAHPVQFRNIWALETQTVELVPGPVGIRRLEGGFHPGRITVGKIVPGFTSMPDIQGIIRLYKLDGSVCRANTAMKQLMPGVFIKPASD